MSTHSPRALAAPGLLLLLAAGCSPSDMSPVKGRVMMEDGTPAKGGTVLLQPADPHLPSGRGDIRPDGSFELNTNVMGDGVKLGSYKVVVLPPSEDYSPRNPPPIDEKFGDVGKSGIEFTVQPGDNTLNVTVHPPRPDGKAARPAS